MPSRIPAFKVPLVSNDSTIITTEWFTFFSYLFQLVGNGTSDVSIPDTLVGPPHGSVSLTTADIPLPPVRIATTTPVTVSLAEALAGVTIICRLTVPGAVAVSIPRTGRVTIKDGTGDAGLRNITVTPVSGTIDGAATDTIGGDYTSRTYVHDGSTEWSIV